MTARRVAPGGRIGILGGGQLGRMLALAAAQLGYRCHIYDPDPKAPAAAVSAGHWQAGWDDSQALAAFARAADIITYEWENVPLAVVDQVAALCPVEPGRAALAIAQDRLSEKRFAASQGIACGPYAAVDDRAGLEAAMGALGLPLVLKTRRMGYDGKGQARLHQPADADAAWALLAGRPAIAEAFVAFEREISVILARTAAGAIVHWGPVENIHADGILQTSQVPATVSPAIAAAALSATARLAAALDYVGVMAAEFFVAGDALLFNEMAPRVHNSGHWTIEGATTSQFENHIRALCGLPLGSPALLAPARMQNLIGADVDRWPALLADPAAHVHLYGKEDARFGRKMGHVTWVGRR